MPESFDAMLAELADAAAGSAVSPDLAAVRRRARRRSVHRRVTASVLAVALLCVAGVAGATVQGHFRRPSRVNALSVQGASSATAGTSTASGAATADPGGTTGDSFVGIWKTGSLLESEYLMVFPDGVVALTETDGSPLCYGRASGPFVSAQAAGASSVADPSAGLVVNSTSASAASPAASPNSATLEIPVTEAACQDIGSAANLILRRTSGVAGLTLVVPAKADSAYDGVAYSRVDGITAQSAAGGGTTLARFAGVWQSAAGKVTQMLEIGKTGSVLYAATGVTGSASKVAGQVDAYYSVGVRVLTGCSSGDTAADCGVLLIQPGQDASEMTVYSGSGPETFLRIK